MNITKRLIPESKHSLKCPYPMVPLGICIHNTANNASAANEIAYMTNNNQSTSFHIAIDDIEAIQGIPFTRNAFAAGDGAEGRGNRNYIHIEICHSLSGGPKFIQAEKNTAIVVAKLLKEYGWTLSNVKKHQDFSGKYCPHRTMDMGYQRFLDMIQVELNKINKPVQSTIYRVRKAWLDIASQKGAFSSLNSAIDLAKSNFGYKVFDPKGVQVYPSVVADKPTTVTSSNVGKFLNLKPTMEKWAIYKVAGPYTLAHKIGEVLPKKFNGLSYKIEEEKAKDVYVISTESYGKVAIYAPRDNDSTITTTKSYGITATATVKKTYVNLKPHMTKWAVYKENGPYTSAYKIGELAPKTYGGLSYEVLKTLAKDVYLIQTGSYGKVAIYVPVDNDSVISNTKMY